MVYLLTHIRKNTYQIYSQLSKLSLETVEFLSGLNGIRKLNLKNRQKYFLALSFFFTFDRIQISTTSTLWHTHTLTHTYKLDFFFISYTHYLIILTILISYDKKNFSLPFIILGDTPKRSKHFYEHVRFISMIFAILFERVVHKNI